MSQEEQKGGRFHRVLRRLSSRLSKWAAGLCSWIRRHRRISICAVIALLLCGALLGRMLFSARQPSAAADGAALVRTTTLQRTSLTDAISATGTVESQTVSNVTTSLKYTVSEVPVQVGDTVEAGDVICVLDSSQLQEEIEKAQNTLSDTIAQAQKSCDKAQSSFDTASDQAAQAEAAYSSAQAAYNTALANFQQAQSTISALQSAYDTAKAKADAAAEEVAAKLNAYTAAQASGGDTQQALAALNAANQAYEGCDWGGVGTGGLKAEAESALAALDSGKALCGYSQLEQTLNTASQTMEQARSALDTAESQYTAAEEQLASAKEALETSSSSDTLTELQDQLEDCTLKASTAGTVTALNATVGSAVTDSVVATIQDTDALKIAITVEEYDIASLQVGLPVIITSDATGDTAIEGTLSQISKTASAGQTGDTGFACEVTVDTADSGLLIGMNAKAEILLSVTEDVFTVPIDAVGTDDAGNSVVYVKSGEGPQATFTPVEVTTGEENDYYIEISGDALTEGMEIRASADPDEAIIGGSDGDDSSQSEMAGFSFGGGMGGEAPAGQTGARPEGDGDRGGAGGPMGG